MTTDLETVKTKAWIYQSNYLIEAKFCLTTLEHKIIRLIASMINYNDSKFEECHFKVSELAELFCCNKKSIYKQIENVSKLLMSRYIEIKDIDNPKRWAMFHLIGSCKLNNGLLSIRIDDEMRPFYFELQQYTKYQLRNILEFKGKYSFRIYELMKQYEKLGKREIQIKELKEMLQINEKSYSNYSNICKRILLPAQTEINKTTDIVFEFKGLKSGKNHRVDRIKFSIRPRKDESQVQLKEPDKEIDKEINEVIERVKEKHGFELHPDRVKIMVDEKGIEKINYYIKSFDKFNLMDINNKAGLFYNAVMKDYPVPAGPSYKNFNQTEYDKDFFEGLYKNV